MEDLNIELVRWVDASSLDGPWADLEEAADLLEHVEEPCTSVGFVLEENERVIVLAASLTDTQIGGTIAIPKVAITRRIQLQLTIGPEDPQIASRLNGVDAEVAESIKDDGAVRE